MWKALTQRYPELIARIIERASREAGLPAEPVAGTLGQQRRALVEEASCPLRRKKKKAPASPRPGSLIAVITLRHLLREEKQGTIGADDSAHMIRLAL
jgi:hypothetical protein